MRIDHIAIWTYDLEGLKNFYLHYFDATPGEAYYNHSKEFRSYFLKFDGCCRIEIMEMPNIAANRNNPLKRHVGITHFSIDVGSRINVDEKFQQLRADGFRVIGEPRITGDGYYEAVVLDPDGNRIELLSH